MSNETLDNLNTLELLISIPCNPSVVVDIIQHIQRNQPEKFKQLIDQEQKRRVVKLA